MCDIDNVEKQKCKICHEEKPLNEFVKDKRCKNGYRSICKKCRNKYCRRLYIKKSKIVYNPNLTKRCTKCGVIKKIIKFNKNKIYKYGVFNTCKKCRNERIRKIPIKIYNSNLTKKCNNCLIVKKITEFQKNKQGKYNVKAVCKKCYNEKYNNLNKIDLKFKIKTILKSSLYIALKKYTKTGKMQSSSKYGINYKSIIKKLAKTLPKDHKEKKYHIDHIIPCSAFNLEDPFEVFCCYHKDNLQWLTEYENTSKSNKFSIKDKNNLLIKLQLEYVEFLLKKNPKENVIVSHQLKLDPTG